MDLAQDTLLNNRYRIQYKLGQGGMGAVYLARDIALDHDVAVKANLSPAAESTNQFLREARLLAALRHPNLPRVTDYFILDGVQFLVMDYVPGRDLDSLLKEQDRQPLERVLAWAGQIGSALTYMHRQTPPVIHRDIKPGNIRLSAEGQAILVDFGIAKALPSDQVTETAVHGYTPGFAPPEQYGGMRTSAQSDQYALAATLYTLLAGQKPADAIQRALDQAVLTPLATYAPEVPPAVQAAIERALSVRPEMRFPSVDDFIRGLSAPAAEPIGMPPGSMYPPPAEAVNSPVAARRPSKPGWLIWAIIGSGALVGLAILAVDLLLVLPRLRGAAGSVPATLPAAVQVIPSETQSAPETETPIPPSETAAPPTATVTVTLAAATATEQLPTETRAAVAAAPIGQGGVIVFSSDREDGKTLQLWTLRAGLNDQAQVVVSDPKQITSGEGDKTQPRWSPDGTQLLFVAPGGGSNGLDIWKMPVDGSSAPLNLTHRKGDDTEPAWSPDGALVAFTNNGREDGVRQLFLMNADGSEAVRLSFDQEEFGATWSPDMRRLAFVMNASGRQILNLRERAEPVITPSPYYVTPQRFDFSTLAGSLGQVAQPAWSPDGAWMAYTRQEGSLQRIFLARYPVRNPDQDVVKLTDSNKDSAPAWAPDSQWLVFNSARDGNAEVYLMRFNGQGQVNLTNAPGRDLDPAWQPAP